VPIGEKYGSWTDLMLVPTERRTLANRCHKFELIHDITLKVRHIMTVPHQTRGLVDAEVSPNSVA
jgi:hypothetical protein